MKELEKELKELRGLQPHGGSNSVNRPDLPDLQGDWTTNQRVHMEEPLALASTTCGRGWPGWMSMKGVVLGLRVFYAPV